MDWDSFNCRGRGISNKITEFIKNNKFLFFVLGGFFFVLSYLILFKTGSLTLHSDDIIYLKSAENLVQNGRLSCQNPNISTAFITPGMTLLLAPLALVFKSITTGIGLVFAKFLMLFFGIGSIAISYLLAERLFNKRVAIATILILALYAPFGLISTLTLTEIPFIFLLLLLISVFLDFSEDKKPKTFIFLLLIFWVALMIRPTVALIPFFLIPILIKNKFQLKSLLIYGLSAIMLLAILMIPWWVRNYSLFGRFVPLSTGSSNPLNVGTYDINDSRVGPLEFANYKYDRYLLLKDFVSTENAQDSKITSVHRPQADNLSFFYKQLDFSAQFLNYNNLDSQKAFEFEKGEEKFGKERMAKLFKENPKKAVYFYFVKKPIYLWSLPYYPIAAKGTELFIKLYHRAILVFAFVGLLSMVIDKKKAALGLSLIGICLYTTALYSYYYAFERYNLAIMPLVIIASSYALMRLFDIFNNIFCARFPSVCKSIRSKLS